MTNGTIKQKERRENNRGIYSKEDIVLKFWIPFRELPELCFPSLKDLGLEVEVNEIQYSSMEAKVSSISQRKGMRILSYKQKLIKL